MLVLGAFCLPGCARTKGTVVHRTPPLAPTSPAPPAATPTQDQKLIVTPGTSLSGTVARVNPAARFVVLTFGLGRLPALDQVMPLYRQGLKVGEVRITGPRLDENVVADLVAGEAQIGDEVRER